MTKTTACWGKLFEHNRAEEFNPLGNVPMPDLSSAHSRTTLRELRSYGGTTTQKLGVATLIHPQFTASIRHNGIKSSDEIQFGNIFAKAPNAAKYKVASPNYVEIGGDGGWQDFNFSRLTKLVAEVIPTATITADDQACLLKDEYHNNSSCRTDNYTYESGTMVRLGGGSQSYFRNSDARIISTSDGEREHLTGGNVLHTRPHVSEKDFSFGLGHNITLEELAEDNRAAHLDHYTQDPGSPVYVYHHKLKQWKLAGLNTGRADINRENNHFYESYALYKPEYLSQQLDKYKGAELELSPSRTTIWRKESQGNSTIGEQSLAIASENSIEGAQNGKDLYLNSQGGEPMGDMPRYGEPMEGVPPYGGHYGGGYGAAPPYGDFSGSPEGEASLLRQPAAVISLQSDIDQGAGAIYVGDKRPSYVKVESPNGSNWTGAGLVVHQGSVLDWKVGGNPNRTNRSYDNNDGSYDGKDRLVKLGKGTLRVYTPDSGEHLLIGEGKVVIDANRPVFGTIELTSGRGTLVLSDENSLNGNGRNEPRNEPRWDNYSWNRTPQDTPPYQSEIRFGYRGGTLDLNGKSARVTKIEDEGAQIVNRNMNQAASVSLSGSMKGLIGERDYNNINVGDFENYSSPDMPLSTPNDLAMRGVPSWWGIKGVYADTYGGLHPRPSGEINVNASNVLFSGGLNFRGTLNTSGKTYFSGTPVPLAADTNNTTTAQTTGEWLNRRFVVGQINNSSSHFEIGRNVAEFRADSLRFSAPYRSNVQLGFKNGTSKVCDPNKEHFFESCTVETLDEATYQKLPQTKIYIRDIVYSENANINVGKAWLYSDLYSDNVTLSKDAIWQLQNESRVQNLQMEKGSKVYLNPKGQTDRFNSLTLGNLSGEGLFRFNTDLARLAGNLVKVNSATGTHTVAVANSGAEPTTAGSLDLFQITDNKATFQLENGHVEAGAFRWYLHNLGNVVKLDTKLPDEERERKIREEEERQAAEEAERQRLAAEEAERQRLAAEEAERQRLAAEEAERQRLAAEEAERQRLAAEEAERQRLAAEEAERQRLAAEDAERQRLAAEEAERQRLAAEEAERQRLAAEEAERQRLAAEEAERQRLAAEEAERQRLAAEEAERQRLAAEEAERQRLAAEEAERQRLAAEEAERQRLAAEEAERQRLAAEEAERQRLAAEEAERQRLAAEEAERQRLAAEEAERQRLAAEEAERQRLAAEEAERQRLAAEEAERQRLAAEEAERQRLAAEEAERQRLAAEEAERQRLAAEEAERQRLAAEEAERQRLASEEAERQRLAAEEAERQRLAAEEAERQRLAAEEAERQRLAAEEAERQRLAAEEAERQRLAAEEAERQRLAAEEAERQRLAAEEAERQRLAAEEAERQRLAAEEAERQRLAAEEAERQRLADEEAERQAAEEADRNKASETDRLPETTTPPASQPSDNTANNGTPAENNGSTAETAPAENNGSTAETAPAENNGSTAETTPAENNGSTAETAPTENNGSTVETTPAENNGSTAETTPAENNGSTAETAPTESNGSTAETTPAENNGSTAETTPAENNGSTAETAPVENNGSTAETTPAENNGSTAETTAGNSQNPAESHRLPVRQPLPQKAVISKYTNTALSDLAASVAALNTAGERIQAHLVNHDLPADYFNVWTNTQTSQRQQHSDRYRDFRTEGSQTQLGVDFNLGNNAMAGVALTEAKGSHQFADQSADKTRLRMLSTYAKYQLPSGEFMAIDLGVGKLKSHIRQDGDNVDVSRSTLQAGLTAGKAFKVANAEIKPFVGARFSQLGKAAYQQNGANISHDSVKQQSYVMGVNVGYNLAISSHFSLKPMLAWQYAIHSGKPKVSVNGYQFDLAADKAQSIEAGLGVKFHNVQLDLLGGVSQGKQTRQQKRFSANLSISF